MISKKLGGLSLAVAAVGLFYATAPAVSCAIAHKERAHEHTGPAESIRPSLRNHAVTLCVYFNNFTRIERTLVVIPAIAAGIADKVLHEVGCAALMNANQAPALRGPYKKRVTEIEISKLRHSPILRLEKNKTASDESRNFAD